MAPNVREELAHLSDVPLVLEARIPCLDLKVSEILALTVGSIVTTSRAAGETINFSVGGDLAGQAELVVVDDCLAVRLSDFGEKI
jgi:flagellar motor switch/type III secretory pathway protein FliN